MTKTQKKDNIFVVVISPSNTHEHGEKMLRCTNGAKGLDVVREDEKIRFIGLFSNGLWDEMVISVTDAKTMFNYTGTIEVSDERGHVGLISYMPQESSFIFSHIGQRGMAAQVNSVELKREVKKNLSVA